MVNQLSSKLPYDQLLTKWSSSLNPVLALPLLGYVQVSGINLTANTPQLINHKLGVQPQGWIICDITGAAEVYRKAWSTSTITLESSANVSISILVF